MAISLLVLLPSDLLWFLFDGFLALLCPIISIVGGGLLSNPGAVFTPPGCPQWPHPLSLFTWLHLLMASWVSQVPPAPFYFQPLIRNLPFAKAPPLVLSVCLLYLEPSFPLI